MYKEGSACDKFAESLQNKKAHKTGGGPITRDQVEKMRGEWRFPIFAEQQDANDPRCQCSECESIETPLARHRFCPSCGAPMTDEAVDVLWKRLEAMQDASDRRQPGNAENPGVHGGLHERLHQREEAKDKSKKGGKTC